MRRASVARGAAAPAPRTAAPLLRSLLALPTDYGLLCLVFGGGWSAMAASHGDVSLWHWFAGVLLSFCPAFLTSAAAIPCSTALSAATSSAVASPLTTNSGAPGTGCVSPAGRYGARS